MSTTPPRSILLQVSTGLALVSLFAGCMNRQAQPSLVVTTVPHAAEVSAEPALSSGEEWLEITPLHLDAGQLNLEVTNRTTEEVTVRWGSAALVGLDGSQSGVEVTNLKLDAKGALPVPSKLAPHAVVQVRMTPDRAPRFPDTAADATEAQQLCEETAGREMRLTLPAQQGSERRVYTMRLLPEVHVTFTVGERANTFTCGGAGPT